MTIYTEFVSALGLVDYSVMDAATTSIGTAMFVTAACTWLLMVVGDTRNLLWSDKVQEEEVEMPEADVFELLEQILKGQVQAIDELQAQVEEKQAQVVGDSYLIECEYTHQQQVNNDLYDMEDQGVAQTMNWFNTILLAVPAPVADAVAYTYKTHLRNAVRALGTAVTEVGKALVTWADNETQPVIDRQAEVEAHQKEVMTLLQGNWTTVENFTDEQGWPTTDSGSWLPVEIDGYRVTKAFWN